ncbi:ribonuclease P protein component [uncultured Ferrovibrio sp.]|jgi:ribonuclease P protein component|uniref:ribonuclease P protein component n=1 Tax=uncultured Ferrovibrio sp. TaxID=1576913 RepID=UPI00260E1679|nr:ribonuclease P protein component [uncultured Ferrovibrio sp.]
MATGGVERLRRRADYLRVQAADRRAAFPGLLLQAAPGQEGCCRVGFTASRKVGNAVTRNRARRRLKALAAEILPRHAACGHDYVLVARQATPQRDFAALRRDLESALKKLKLWQAAEMPRESEAS